MKHRSSLSPKERSARSKAVQLIHDKPLILGSLVEMANTCGKPNCKCTKGEKHKSLYIPTHAARPFRFMSPTCSETCRPLIPAACRPLFWMPSEPINIVV